MNYYEIFKDGLKIIVKTDVTNIDIKMSKFFNGCFIINNYKNENHSKELVVIDIVDRKSIDYYKDDYFIMNPNTWILYLCFQNFIFFSYNLLLMSIINYLIVVTISFIFYTTKRELKILLKKN